MTMTRLVLVLSAVVALGCGRGNPGTGGGSGGSGGSGGGAEDRLSATEQDALDRGNDAHLASQNMLEVMDRLFQFDPTLDTAKTAVQNAMAIQAQASAELATCGMATLSGSTVTVAFGAPPGCTLASGTTASGTISLSVAASAGTITVATTFTSLVVNGKPLDGSLSFSTTNATTFKVTGDLKSGGNTSTLDLTVTGSTNSMSLSGTTKATDSASVSTTLTFTQVVLVKRDCYPSSGSVKYEKGALSQTLTFLSTTPKDGKATLRIGLKTYPVKLPAYGKCPPPSDGG